MPLLELSYESLNYSEAFFTPAPLPAASLNIKPHGPTVCKVYLVIKPYCI